MTEQMAAASAHTAVDDACVLNESHERQKKDGQHLRLALISKTGHGKSSLGNLLLGRKVFDESRGFSSGTVTCNAASGVVEGRWVTIVDSPGTMDTRDPEAALKELVNAIQFSPEGFHAFLIVVNATVRYTDEEHRAIQALRQIFGDRLFEFCIVVFTHGDTFDNDEDQLKEALQQSRTEQPRLDELLKWCNNRVALTEKRCDQQVQRRQIVSLLEKVEDLVSRNGGVYTDEIFQVAQREEKKKRREEERREKEKEELEMKQTEEIKRLMKEFQDLQRQQEMERLQMEQAGGRLMRERQDLQRQQEMQQQQKIQRLLRQQAEEREHQRRRHKKERETEEETAFLSILTAIGRTIGRALGFPALGPTIGATVKGVDKIFKSCAIQ